MEAASARYATRDRFGAWGEPALTPLQRYIRTYGHDTGSLDFL